MSEIYGTFSTAYVEAMRLRLSALEPENKDLRARVAELEADSKRLDWLLRRGVAWRGCYNGWWSEGEWLYEKGKSRDIIDEAMEAKPCPHCLRVECECSDFDVAPDMGDK